MRKRHTLAPMAVAVLLAGARRLTYRPGGVQT